MPKSRRPGHTGLLVAIGDLVEDVVVWPTGPLSYATDNPSTIRRAQGGSAANVAVMASALGPTRFIGRVGEDALGQSLVDGLVQAGVEPKVQRAGRTGCIMILVDGKGERTMFPDRAAAAELADVPTEWVDGAGVVHAPAYCFATEASLVTTVALLVAARERGALVSLDAASVSLLLELGVERYLDLVRSIRPEFLFANAAEATLLGLDEAVLPHSMVIVKDGPRPVVVAMPDGTSVSIDVEPVAEVRDTTGAGDAFAAGYLSAVLGGADPVTAARIGSELAASVLSSPGATVGSAELIRQGVL